MRVCFYREMTQHCRRVGLHWLGWVAPGSAQCRPGGTNRLHGGDTWALGRGGRAGLFAPPSWPPFSLAWLSASAHPFRFILETLFCPGFSPRPHQAGQRRRTRPIQHHRQFSRACSQLPRLLLPQPAALRRCANLGRRSAVTDRLDQANLATPVRATSLHLRH